MPVYSYRALNAQGKTIKGVVDADNATRARQKLRSEGLYPVDVQTTGKKRTKEGLKSKGRRSYSLPTRRLRLVADMTRQLATLLAAGLPLVTALSTIQEQIEDPDFGHRLALIREEVTGGEALAAALEKNGDIFPSEYVHLVRAGEMSGALDQVLGRLADNLERRQARRASITAALAYPAFMTLVGSGVLFFLLSFIVPSLTGLFDNLDAALPWPTITLLAVSGFMENYWWATLLIGLLVFYMLKQYLKKEAPYRRVEAWIFSIPLVGVLIKKLLVAQAIRSLAVMIGGGVALTTALDVTAKGLGKSNYAAALTTTAEMVAQGRSLADGLEASGLFPPVARRMIAVGETSGTLTEMLNRVAGAYEMETDRVLSALTSLVEPFIILLMGLLVGFVVMAVLLPIFDLSGLVG